MNNALNLLLQLALSASIHDKDVFIDKVSTFLQEKMQADPEKGEKLGEEVLSILEQLKDELTLNRLVSKVSKPQKDLSVQIGELTEAINKLNENLMNKKG